MFTFRRRPAQSEGRPVRRDRGQVLVIVALSMTVLIAMAGLVVDAGISWANRRQVQNVADAAALGGTRIIAVDRYEKVYDPSAPPTFANPGAAIQAAISNAFTYSANSGQAFTAPMWGAPGSPEYTDYKARRFPNPDFPAIGPLYVVSGAIPSQAQGVYVPATAQTQTLVIRIMGINTVNISTTASAVTGPSIPLGNLLPLVVHDRYTQCADSACLPPVGPPPPVYGQNNPLPGPVPYQRTFQEGCQYNFRQSNPGEIACNGSTDPTSPLINPNGNFGWLSWTGGPPANSSLVSWIQDPVTAPTAWYTTACADPVNDETCRVDDGILPPPQDDRFWRIAGTTGNKQAALDELDSLYQGKEVYVPIWRSSQDPGNGAHSVFEVVGFGVFRVDAVIRTGSNKGFTGTFLGSYRGGNIEQCTIVPNTCPGSGSAPITFGIDLAK